MALQDFFFGGGAFLRISHSPVYSGVLSSPKTLLGLIWKGFSTHAVCRPPLFWDLHLPRAECRQPTVDADTENLTAVLERLHSPKFRQYVLLHSCPILTCCCVHVAATSAWSIHLFIGSLYTVQGGLRCQNKGSLQAVQVPAPVWMRPNTNKNMSKYPLHWSY